MGDSKMSEDQSNIERILNSLNKLSEAESEILKKKILEKIEKYKTHQ